MAYTQKLNQIQKGALVILGTLIFAYLSGSVFGKLSCALPNFCDFGGAFIGTEEQWRSITGFLIAPTFYLSFFFFLLITKEEKFLRGLLITLFAAVVLLNAAIGLSSIIFSVAFIALGYASAKFLLYLKSIIYKS